jgi:hypothetical protein
MQVDPYLPPTRPVLDTEVRVNGKLATTWHFSASGDFSSGSGGASDNHKVLEVEVPISAAENCKTTIDLRFARPGAAPAPYPKAEDPRPLQLRVVGMKVVAAPALK